MTVPVAQIDLKVGGKFRVEMQQPDGGRYVATGEYREVSPPRRVVYTWSWQDKPDVTDSLITVEFHDRGTDTEVVLRHERLPNAKEVSGHTSGWTSILEKFAARF